jgi:hypothetical protein
MKTYLTEEQRSAASSSMNIEQLRKIALLKFYIAVNELDVSLWTTDLQSGTGALEDLESSKDKSQQQGTTTTTTVATKGRKLKRWPSDLKNKMISSGIIIAEYSEIIASSIYLEYIDE